ncbi:hypothetical protein C8A01DRAFT_39064 [Parachaetomium inaequale]|uniref:Uncharacterized protein n=1 Tax=Parachaetomium inaequale TaxID=2588326 RepID=A0AAN6PCW5_9PEZI|nr:hypothetical protein C8A01DRAFT_39064 [Parachaetomium inaequale]
MDDGLAQRTFPNLTSLRLRSYCWDKSRQDGCECQSAVEKFLEAAPNLDSLELDGFGILEGRLILPPRLTSLVLVDTWYASGSDAQDPVRGFPQLKRFCTYNGKYRKLPTPPPSMAGLSEPLFQLPVADTLVTLGLCSSRLDELPAVDMGRFRALKALAINCGSGEARSIGLLLNSIRDCRCLRDLVVDGADRIPRDELMRFAHAVSRLEYPSLRKITLAPRDVACSQRPGLGQYVIPHPVILRGRLRKILRSIAEEPVPGLLRAGGVELVLHERGGNQNIRKLFAEIEES